MSERRFGDPGAALRDGLRRQDVPDVSPDFDERVLAAVHRPSGWSSLWPSLRPALAAGTVSMVAMLGFIHWGLTAPTSVRVATPVTAAAPALDLDRLLEHPDVLRGGLYAWRPAPRPQPSTKPQGGRSSLPSSIA